MHVEHRHDSTYLHFWDIPRKALHSQLQNKYKKDSIHSCIIQIRTDLPKSEDNAVFVRINRRP